MDLELVAVAEEGVIGVEVAGVLEAFEDGVLEGLRRSRGADCLRCLSCVVHLDYV